MGGGQSALAKKTEMARKTGSLSLRSLDLEKVPDERLLSIPNLRILDLSHNKIKALTARIGALKHLTALTLDHNKLRALPEGLCTLTALETLSATHNALQSLPAAFGSLTKLKKLALEHNALAALPESIGGCRALGTLNVSHNALATLPAGLGQCTAILALDASHNKLASPLPDSLGGLSRRARARGGGGVRARAHSRGARSGLRLKDLDLRGNAVLRELPAPLLTSTPLAKLQVDDARACVVCVCYALPSDLLLQVDDALRGKDGMLKETAGSEEYLRKRKARIDKELHGKQDGGGVHLSG